MLVDQFYYKVVLMGLPQIIFIDQCAGDIRAVLYLGKIIFIRPYRMLYIQKIFSSNTLHKL